MIGVVGGWLLKHWKPLAAFLLLALAVWRIHAHGVDSGRADVQAQWNAENAAEALAAAAAAEEARKTEARHRAEYRAITERFLAEQRKADEDHEATLRALRAGTVRVRERFTCPAVPGAAADPAGAVAAGARGLGVEDAAEIIGAARDADRIAAQLNALIDAVEAGRR